MSNDPVHTTVGSIKPPSFLTRLKYSLTKAIRASVPNSNRIHFIRSAKRKSAIRRQAIRDLFGDSDSSSSVSSSTRLENQSRTISHDVSSERVKPLMCHPREVQSRDSLCGNQQSMSDGTKRELNGNFQSLQARKIDELRNDPEGGLNVWLERREAWTRLPRGFEGNESFLNPELREKLKKRRAETSVQSIGRNHYKDIYVRLVQKGEPLKHNLNLADAVQIIHEGWIATDQWPPK